ncbi:hypothetical protein TNIN_451201 [Trichonephila inaurata madagascariensis]|uniref:Uncharacterized protein n=1 Tax=Trichonephila inaurata madagascariensis TaxID=2747483 RepID=A0A8X6YJ02_9ARAC|nr:hypothetical protein TNIN_451201 [Trichonephila inaurata madagascariensis]
MESKRKVALSVDSLDSVINFILSGNVVECWKSDVITLLKDSDEHVNNQFQTFELLQFCYIVITLKRRGNVCMCFTYFPIIFRKNLNFVYSIGVVSTTGSTPVCDVHLPAKKGLLRQRSMLQRVRLH